MSACIVQEDDWCVSVLRTLCEYGFRKLKACLVLTYNAKSGKYAYQRKRSPLSDRPREPGEGRKDRGSLYAVVKAMTT